MKRFVLFLLALMLLCGLAPVSGAESAAPEADFTNLTYELVWADEFDTDGRPDAAHWRYDTGGSGWGNNELQYYTAGDNASVADGVLTIAEKLDPYQA